MIRVVRVARRFRSYDVGWGSRLGSQSLVGPLTVNKMLTVGPKIMVLEQ